MIILFLQLISWQSAYIISVHDIICQRVFIFVLGIRFIDFIHKLHFPAEIISFVTKKTQSAVRLRILLQQIPADKPFRRLNALKAQVGDGVKVEGKSKKIAGNNFTGFAFDGMNGQDAARSEVLVTQVNGYALVLQVVAPDQDDIDNILKNFS